MAEMRSFECSDCKHKWQILYGIGRPKECPECKNTNIHRSEDDRGYARRCSHGFGRRRFGRL